MGIRSRITNIRKQTLDRFVFGMYHNLPHLMESTIWEGDWDICIVLDACRPDVLEHHAESFEFIPKEVPQKWSVASSSLEWIQETFIDHPEDAANSIYVTANVHSELVFSGHELAKLDEVWRYAWLGDIGTVPPKAVSDSIIRHGRERTTERIVAHYMQPHFPSIPDGFGSYLDRDDINDGWGGTWGQIQKGDLSAERAWESYKENTYYVLQEVERVLSNVDGDVLITADHANSWGQWGYWGHPSGKPVPEIRYVPWIRTSAQDDESAELGQWDKTGGTTKKEQLHALGYR